MSNTNLTKTNKKGYDPHLLYQAINITVELQYTVPMTLIYNILLKLKLQRKENEPEPSVNEMIRMISLLGKTMQADEDCPVIEDSNRDLQTRIKYLLRMAGCNLTPQELNSVLRGQIPLTQVMNRDAQLLWSILFSNKDGKYIPEPQNTGWMLDIAQEHTMGQILKEYNNNCLKYAAAKARQLDNQKANVKIERARSSPQKYLDRNQTLEAKLRKLRLYIAHIQGYDRDRDGDGERGVDPETGYVRDYDDIFLANHLLEDNIEDPVQEDRERDI